MLAVVKVLPMLVLNMPRNAVRYTPPLNFFLDLRLMGF
jgi:hypothetical protein